MGGDETGRNRRVSPGLTRVGDGFRLPFRRMSACTGIVIRTKNRPALLPRALRSVAAQTSPNWRLMVVNDVGARAPVETAVNAVWPAGDARVHILHRDSSTGMESASNAGVEALGVVEFLAIHDDDDAWDPGFLARLSPVLEAAPSSVSGVVCHTTRVVETIAADGRVAEQTRHPFNAWLQGVTLARMLAENSFPPISFLFRHEAWATLGGFDERLPVLGDWEFNVRLLLQGDIHVVPEALAFYHHRAAVDGVYANTVTAADARHRAVEAQLRARWAHDPSLSPVFAPFAAQMAENLAWERAVAVCSPALPSGAAS